MPSSTQSPTATDATDPNGQTEASANPLAHVVRRKKLRRYKVLFAQVILLGGGLLAWELLSGAPDDPLTLIDSYYVSQPSDVVDALVTWAERGILVSSIVETARVTLLGLFWGILGGMVVGFALGVNAMLSSILHPFISALYSIPRLALIPLFLLWFGIGMGARLAMVVVIVFFLVFYNTYSGVRDVDSEQINVLKVMGASRWQIYRKVVLQSATMWIIAGLRIAVPYALVGAVTAEMLIADAGLGFLVIRSAGQFYTQGVFAGITLMMLMSMVLSGGVTVIERRALRWKPDVDAHAAI